jgi:hypothetical protein
VGDSFATRQMSGSRNDIGRLKTRVGQAWLEARDNPVDQVREREVGCG